MVLHLYGVTTADAPPPPDLKGRRDGELRLVSAGDLAVIVSDVDADTPAGRKDLLAHAHVLEGYAEESTVLHRIASRFAAAAQLGVDFVTLSPLQSTQRPTTSPTWKKVASQLAQRMTGVQFMGFLSQLSLPT